MNNIYVKDKITIKSFNSNRYYLNNNNILANLKLKYYFYS